VQKKLLVGAIGFEPTTPCAQGRKKGAETASDVHSNDHNTKDRRKECGHECGQKGVYEEQNVIDSE
jgi:hypothetical protein